MLVIKYNIKNIYIKLKTFDTQHYHEKLGIMMSEEKVDPNFARRIDVNGWTETNTYYYFFNTFSSTTVYNLQQTIDMWNGGIIFYFDSNVDSKYFNSLIKYCLDMDKDVYLINNKYPVDMPFSDNKKVHIVGNLNEI